jgi:hypothetical protein
MKLKETSLLAVQLNGASFSSNFTVLAWRDYRSLQRAQHISVD